MSIRLQIGATFDATDIHKVERELKAMRRQIVTTSDKIKNAGVGLAKFGAGMTKAFTVPLAGAGIAAIKTAADFGSSMAKIVGLVGIASSEVKGMESAVLALSGQTAKSPQELADALFVVTSAGLRGSEAMDALEAAAKASAAGLGTTSDIARSVSGVLNAYGSSVGSAAKVTDVLVATARAGNFETSQFAAALGRVLPFASQAGASIEDVGGAVALLTRTNGNAAESITQVQSLFRAFVVPTEEAKKVLDGVGLSAADLRDQLGRQGLVATLTTLDEALGGNRELLGRLLGSSEAASAAFQILNANGEDVAATFGVVNDAAGLTDDAFRNVSGTASFKFNKVLTELSVAAVDLGNVLLPVVTDIVDKFTELITKFNGLTDAQKRTVVAIGLLVAATGPLLSLIGLATAAFGLLAGAAAAAGIALLPFTLIVIAAALVVTALATAFFLFRRESNRAKASTEAFAKAQQEGLAKLQAYRTATTGLTEETVKNSDALAANTDELEPNNDAKEKAGPIVVALTRSMRGLLQSINETNVGTSSGGDLIAQFSRELLAAGSITDETADAAKRLASAVRDTLDKALADGNRRLEEAKRKFDSFRDSIASGITTGNRLSDAVSGQTSAIDALTRAEERLEEAKASGDKDGIAEAQKDLAAAKKQERSFLSFLQTGADTAEGFAQQIDSLRLAGASMEVVQQIAQLGAETGGRVIAELLAGGAEAIAQANRLVAAVEEASSRAGVAAAQQFFGAGVRSAQRFIDAVEATIPELQSVLDTIAEMINKALGSNVKLDVSGRTTFLDPAKPSGGAAAATAKPNTRQSAMRTSPFLPAPARAPFATLAERNAGILRSMGRFNPMAAGGIVTGPTLALIGEAGPEAVIPLSRGGGMGGNNIYVTVTSADPQAVVEALRRYTRANGPLGQVVSV